MSGKAPDLAALVESAVRKALAERAGGIPVVERPWLTTEQAADYLNVGVERLRRELPRWAAKYGVKLRRRNGQARGPWLICRRSLDRMVEQHWK